MKAAPFDYVRPTSVSDAVAELAAADGEGKVLAGGQSLVPVLAMRLARPAVLVDVNAVPGLDELTLADGGLRIGATARQRHVETYQATAAVPLLGMALPWVGHRELRSRGTVCGSLAHADPAAELPAVAALLEAVVQVAGEGGGRTVAARDFFTGTMTTALGPTDVLTAVTVPVAVDGEGFGFAELARRHGDFALAGVAARVRRPPEGGAGYQAVLAGFGVSDRPVVHDVAGLLDEAVRAVGPPDAVPSSDAVAESDAGVQRLAAALTEPLAALAEQVVDTAGDMHASTGYRRRLFAVLGARQLALACHRAHRAPVRHGGQHGQHDRRDDGQGGER